MIYGIIVGLIAGYIASLIEKGKGSGCIINLVLGVAGGMLGGWLFSLFGINSYGWIGEIVVGVIGAVIILWIVNKLR